MTYLFFIVLACGSIDSSNGAGGYCVDVIEVSREGCWEPDSGGDYRDYSGCCPDEWLALGASG